MQIKQFLIELNEDQHYLPEDMWHAGTFPNEWLIEGTFSQVKLLRTEKPVQTCNMLYTENKKYRITKNLKVIGLSKALTCLKAGFQSTNMNSN